MKIKILDDKVINKIAAGEVIENPAAVVKELIENSIDAQANRINIDISQSGMKLIRIADNGMGMDREDAKIALERHATSKLKTDKDLYSLSTMGFRGEALPSIAAVSRFLLRTSTQENQIGTSIRVDGGHIMGVAEDNIAPGTIIEIRDLFYNVPARKKFVRSFHAEKMAINQIFLKLALSHPKIHFTLCDENREVYRLLGTEHIHERISHIFGRDFLSDLIPFKAEGENVSIKGYISHPQLCRNTRSGQYFFVNTRVIRSYQLSQSIRRAYGTLLPAGRFPIVFLYMDIDPSTVDVNIHPTKNEVKFSQLSQVENLVKKTMQDVLKSSKLIFDIKEQNDEFKKINFSYNIPRFNQYSSPADKSSSNLLNPNASQDSSLQPKYQAPFSEIKQKSTDTDAVSSNDMEDDFVNRLDNMLQSEQTDENGSFSAEYVQDTDMENQLYISGIKVVGQIGKCFILCESAEGLVIIDQHAAHERINYEKILRQISSGSLPSQSLMFPVTYQADKIRKKVLLSKIGLLKQAGIGINPFGNDTFIIDALPKYISQTSIIALLEDIIDESRKDSSDSLSNWQEKLAKMMACRSSVKSADKLQMQELQQLADDLFLTQTPYTCPHGRPTIIRMSYGQLRKEFKRE
ncbi:DNA mismatch repair endonuclease MutL [bacterium]|nr:DNA mismatch repair endonuclease MutL [bacterium]